MSPLLSLFYSLVTLKLFEFSRVPCPVWGLVFIWYAIVFWIFFLCTLSLVIPSSFCFRLDVLCPSPVASLGVSLCFKIDTVFFYNIGSCFCLVFSFYTCCFSIFLSAVRCKLCEGRTMYFFLLLYLYHLEIKDFISGIIQTC